MTQNRPPDNKFEPTRVQTPLERLYIEFSENWRSGSRPDLDSFLQRVPRAERTSALINLLRIEVQERRAKGEEASEDEYRQRYPEASDAIDLAFTTHGQVAVNTQAEIEWSVGTQNPQDLEVTQRDPNQQPDTSEEESPWKPGMMLGNYRLDERLDHGGFGEVWKGWDTNLHSVVAIKLLLPRWLNTDYHHEFFLEPQKQRALQQAGAQVVPVLAAATCNDWPYLVSQFLSGGNLQRWMNRHPRDWQVAARVVADLAKTLRIAHAHKVYHRDIKPKNVLLDEKGQVYLGDFGLATTEDQLVRKGLQTGAGTWAYWSPEQAQHGIVEGRSDVYSLGVVLYQWLTGCWPGPTDRNLHRQWLSEPALRAQAPRELNPDIPEELQQICLEMLEKDYTKRNITAGDVERRLRGVLVPDEHRVESREVKPEANSGWKVKVLPAAAVVGLLGMVGLVGPWRQGGVGQNRPEAGESGKQVRNPSTVAPGADEGTVLPEEPLPEGSRLLIQPIGQRRHLLRWQDRLELTPGLLDFTRRRDARQFFVIPAGETLLVQSDYPQFLPFGLATEKPLRQVSWQIETDGFLSCGFFYNFRADVGVARETQFAGLIFFTTQPPEMLPEVYAMHRQFRIDPMDGSVEALGGQDTTRLFEGRAAPSRFRLTLRFQQNRLVAFLANDDLFAIPEGSPQMNEFVGGPFGFVLRRGMVYLSQPKVEFEP